MFRRILLNAVLIVAIWANPALISQGWAAQSAAPKSLGTFGNWRAYVASEKGQNACYMALRAHGAAIKKAKRGTIVLMITHRPADNVRDVVSYAAGYNFKAASDLRISIGKANFDLFTEKDTAWTRDAMTDRALATAIRKNATLTATGTPAVHGAGALTDTITLKGAAEAYQAIGKACGYADEQAPTAPVKKHKSNSKY